MAEELRAAGRDEVLFVGTPDGLEARLVPEAGVSFAPLAARGFDRSRPWTLVTSGALIGASTLRARGLLGRWRPDVVVGFGGYVSIPVGLAARIRSVPLVIHEQNSVPGLANRILSRWACCAAVTYPESAARLKHPDRVVITGNPVRSTVLTSGRERGRALFGVPSDALLLLVFGGSRGARHLNSALIAVRDRLVAFPNVHVIHITGRTEAATVREALAAKKGQTAGVGIAPRGEEAGAGRWKVLEYVDDMGAALAAADLVVARAGATSLAEITALGRPALLVPYPYATDDHQTTNAAALAESGAAEVIADADMDTPRFGDALVRLLADGGARATMAAASARLARPEAAAHVADVARKAAEAAQNPD